MQSLQQMQQQQMIPISEVEISGVAMLHELMTRADFVLPDLKSRWTTL